MLIDWLKESKDRARLAGNKQLVNLWTTVIGECERQYKEATDEQVDSVVRKMIKNARVTNDARPNDQSHYEISTLLAYFPEETFDIESILKNLIAENPDQWMLYVDSGKQEGWWVGQVMKATKGTAKREEIQKILLALT